MISIEQIQESLNTVLFGGNGAFTLLLLAIGAVLALSRFTKLGRL